MVPVDIMFLIDRLEELIQKGTHVPFTSLTLVNEDDILSIIDQLRISIPQEVEEAQRIVQEKERIIARAREEAEKILGQAQERAASLADEHEIVKRAEARARTIEERARRQAGELRRGADEYALEVLRQLEEQLNRILTEVRNGIRKLQSGSSMPEAQDDPIEKP